MADRLPLVAAGVAFYGLLSVFPLLATLIAIWGLFTPFEQIVGHVRAANTVLPDDAARVLWDQAVRISSSERQTTKITAIVGLLLSLVTASRGVSALMTGLDIAAGERERRGFFVFNAVALVLTVGLIVAFMIAFSLVAVAPALLGAVGLEEAMAILLDLLRWPVLFLGALIALGVLYSFGPSRTRPRRRLMWPGSIVAASLWVVASIGFSAYVASFATYNATYGALGGVVILLMWLWLSALSALLGEEINLEVERRRRPAAANSKPSVDERRAEPRDQFSTGA
jgi:membrane protein